jgi:hypothetical protein
MYHFPERTINTRTEEDQAQLLANHAVAVLLLGVLREETAQDTIIEMSTRSLHALSSHRVLLVGSVELVVVEFNAGILRYVRSDVEIGIALEETLTPATHGDSNVGVECFERFGIICPLMGL